MKKIISKKENKYGDFAFFFTVIGAEPEPVIMKAIALLSVSTNFVLISSPFCLMIFLNYLKYNLLLLKKVNYILNIPIFKTKKSILPYPPPPSVPFLINYFKISFITLNN